MIEELGTTQGIAALVAGGIALAALLIALVLAAKLRRIRGQQSTVIGEHGRRDLAEHAARLESAFVDLRDWVDESLSRLDDRVGTAESRIDSCVAYLALVRYDAYGEMSGRQSSSIALLDSRRSGVVVSSILHRDQARVYVKQLYEGAAEHELSPEEMEAVNTAMASARA